MAHFRLFQVNVDPPAKLGLGRPVDVSITMAGTIEVAARDVLTVFDCSGCFR